MTVESLTPSSPKPKRHYGPRRWLDPHLRTRPETAARRLSETVHGMIMAREVRVRKRRQSDAKRFGETVDMLVANLTSLALRYPAAIGTARSASTSSEDTSGADHAWIFYARSGRKRAAWSLPKIVDAMRDAGLVTLRNAIAHSDNKMASRVRPSNALFALIDDRGPSLDDLINTEEQPLIRLRDTRTKSDRSWHKEDAKGALIRDYKPTDETEKWTRELEAINEFLAQAAITYDPALAVTELERRGQASAGLPETLALNERTLRRTFLRRSWNKGGRLSGGWWGHADRRTRLGLRVATEAAPAGEAFVLLDYASAFIQLLYAVKAGVQADRERDHYEGIIDAGGEYGARWPTDPKARASLRDAIKRNVNALFFGNEGEAGPRAKVVRGTRQALNEYGGGISVQDLDARIRQRHPEIAEWFGTDVGFELFRWESDVMVKVLVECAAHGIVALPLHDGVLVPDSRASDAEAIMH